MHYLQNKSIKTFQVFLTLVPFIGIIINSFLLYKLRNNYKVLLPLIFINFILTIQFIFGFMGLNTLVLPNLIQFIFILPFFTYFLIILTLVSSLKI
jgi:hypothetical protein